ncbi:hypothetical protein ASU31_14160 [Pedobacter ginsenosidimutans]|uniref:Uncharacterized protein n=1 Tax=Pedobacter ginsenosidimutans TaxID=687842 RepID=A0A0T5VNQ0_9SPHI|nr:hypothetical protein [Pedobacter ginsenosidimutans]KRT15490.1 hypothetical protein ASU31_14160 [Pedobacter ginsenosidimutans]
MKTKNLMLTILLLAGSITVQAQFLKKLKEKVNATVDRKINATVDKAINKTTDKVVDSSSRKIEKMAKNIGKGKKDKRNASDKTNENKSVPETEKPIVQDSTTRKDPNKAWKINDI